MINKDTEAMISYLLEMLAIKGEKETYSYIRNQVLKGKVPYEKEPLDKLKDALHISV